MSLVDPTQQLLEAAMRGSWQRQIALTGNVANADTPGYQRRDVNFESILGKALGGDQPLQEVAFEAEVQPSAPGPNGEGISLDREEASLSENGLDYEALTQVVGARDQTLRAAIGVA